MRAEVSNSPAVSFHLIFPAPTSTSLGYQARIVAQQLAGGGEIAGLGLLLDEPLRGRRQRRLQPRPLRIALVKLASRARAASQRPFCAVASASAARKSL